MINCEDYYDVDLFNYQKWTTDVHNAIEQNNLDELYSLDCIGSQFIQHVCPDGFDSKSIIDLLHEADAFLEKHKYNPHERRRDHEKSS